MIQNEPTKVSVGTNRQIAIEVLIVRNKNKQINQFQWNCKSIESSNDCSTNIDNQKVMFPQVGKYQIEAKFSEENISKISTSMIEVNSKIIPHVEIKHFPSQPINVMISNQVVVTIHGLIPKCFAAWEILDDELKDIKNSSILGSIYVKDVVEQFLEELVDYDNTTISKDLTLNLPSEFLSQSKKSYDFRLSVTCLEPISTESTRRDNVTTYFDVLLFTNAPPETFPLDIQPLNGVPMKDEFKFTTGTAKDDARDFPLKYTFGYIVDGTINVEIGKFYENSYTQTQLPFSDSIQTYFDVCDNNDACKHVIGPKISSNYSYKYLDKDIDFKVEQFDFTLRRADYADAFHVAVTFLLTMMKIGNNQLLSYEVKMSESMKREIENLKKQERSELLNSNIADFIGMSRKLMPIMMKADENLINEILSLDDQNASRVKRTIDDSTSKVISCDMKYLENFLTLSSFLVKKNSTDSTEKRRFFDKIHQCLPVLCTNQNSNSEKTLRIANFMELEISKVFSTVLSKETQKMPGNASIIINMNRDFPKKFICLVNIRYHVDLFSDSLNDESIFESIIYEDINESKEAQLVIVEKNVEFFMVEIKSEDSLKNCLIFKLDKWVSECSKIKPISSEKVFCKCNSLSIDKIIFKLEKNGKVVSDNNLATENPKNVTSDSSSTKTTQVTTTILPTTAMTVLSTSTTVQTPKESTTITEKMTSTTTQRSTTTISSSKNPENIATTSSTKILTTTTKSSPTDSTDKITTLNDLSTKSSITTEKFETSTLISKDNSQNNKTNNSTMSGSLSKLSKSLET